MDEQKNGTAAPRRRRRPAVEPEVFEAVEQVRTSEQDVPPTPAKPSFKGVPVSHGETKSSARMPKNGNTDGKKKKKKKKSGAGCLIALIVVLLLVVAALAVLLVVPDALSNVRNAVVSMIPTPTPESCLQPHCVHC